jgi:hypothetical protein
VLCTFGDSKLGSIDACAIDSRVPGTLPSMRCRRPREKPPRFANPSELGAGVLDHGHRYRLAGLLADDQVVTVLLDHLLHVR